MSEKRDGKYLAKVAAKARAPEAKDNVMAPIVVKKSAVESKLVRRPAPPEPLKQAQEPEAKKKVAVPPSESAQVSQREAQSERPMPAR